MTKQLGSRIKNGFILLLITGFGGLLQAQTKVACVGNSITYGYGLSSSQAYPSVLQNLLGTDYIVGNFGVSARTLLKKGDRPYWNEPAYQQALAFNPDIVIIMLGTNDSKSINWGKHGNEFNQDYTDLINSFRNLGSNPEIYICILPPAQNVGWNILNSVINDEINPAIMAVAQKNATNVIDVYSVFESKSSLIMADGVHPNAAGAEALAKKVKNNITASKPVIGINASLLNSTEGYGYWWYEDKLLLLNEVDKTLPINMNSIFEYTVAVKTSSESNDWITSDPFKIQVTSISNQEQEKEAVPITISQNKYALNFSVYKSETFPYTLNIFNVNGKRIRSVRNQHGNYLCPLNGLPSGVYFYSVNTINFSNSGKLIVP